MHIAFDSKVYDCWPTWQCLKPHDPCINIVVPNLTE